MRTEKYRQLIDVHLLHRVWQSELDIALQEVNFWEELLNSLNADTEPDPSERDETWKTELAQLHHFRRLIKRLQEEMQELDEQIAAGVRVDHVLDTDSRLTHQYVQAEMDSFHADFRAFKTEIRQYITAQPTF